MATANDYEVAEATKLQKLVAVSVLTSYPALQLQYIGPKAYASVAVSAAGDMTFYADDVNGTTTVDPDIGIDGSGAATATGVVDLSTPHASMNTFGELAAHINKQANWRCFLIGVLNSESTDNTLATLSTAQLKTGAAAGVAANGLTLYLDQAVLLDTGFAITNDGFISQPATGWAGKSVGRSFNSNIQNELNYLYFSIATQANNGSIRIYSCDDAGLVDTAIWSNAYAAGTAEEHGANTTPVDVFLKAQTGHRLCIKFDAVDTAGSGALDARATGHSKHLFGDPSKLRGANYTGCV